VLSKLAPGTYHYRLVAVNPDGTTIGNDSTFVVPTIPGNPAPAVLTGAAGSVKANSATLTGALDGFGVATSYHFEIGRTRAYGIRTRTSSAGAANKIVAVNARVLGLMPRSNYHYRLVATSSAGTTYGADVTFRTAPAVRVRPRSLSVKVSPAHAFAAPYRFTVSGKLGLPPGVSRASACAGSISIQAKRGSNTILTRKAPLSRTCGYQSIITFSAQRLPGTGALQFLVQFIGNPTLLSRNARPVTVRYG
jgi:hypothetical protein